MFISNINGKNIINMCDWTLNLSYPISKDIWFNVNMYMISINYQNKLISGMYYHRLSNILNTLTNQELIIIYNMKCIVNNNNMSSFRATTIVKGICQGLLSEPERDE